MPHAELDEDSIDFDLIARQSRERVKADPVSLASHYDVQSQQPVIELRSGVTISILARLIPGVLEPATSNVPSSL